MWDFGLEGKSVDPRDQLSGWGSSFAVNKVDNFRQDA